MENKVSLARTISIIGTLILCIALVGNSFEVLSVTAFRIIIAFGILIQIISFRARPEGHESQRLYH